MTSSQDLLPDPNDDDALDYLVEAQFDAAAIDRMPEHLRASARRLLGDLRAIDDYPASEPSSLLVDATLARIAQDERQRALRMSITDASQTSIRRRIRIQNLAALAAMLIVAAGIAIPMSAQVRNSQSQTMCAGGLRTLGGALSAYAADNQGIMPMTAGLGSFFTDSLEKETDVIDNARHLEILSKNGYCDAQCTRCNGARSLSYRVPLHASQTSLGTMRRSPIAADANPVQILLRRGIVPRTFDLGSFNHAQRGQNVLFSDGSVVWSISPVLKSGPFGLPDNIWMIRAKNGVETGDLRANPKHPLEVLLMN